MTEKERIGLSEHVDMRIDDLRKENDARHQAVQAQLDRRFESIEAQLRESREASVRAHRDLAASVEKIAGSVASILRSEASAAGANVLKATVWRAAGTIVVVLGTLSAIGFALVDHLS